MDDKLCLQWNDFRENVSSAFERLKDDKDFIDVTLACGDGQLIETHKVVLIASSPFFLNLLKRTKHPHPLIYMRGVKSDDLKAMMEFLYRGEANVDQENLDTFLQLAEELQLKGLTGNQQEEEKKFTPRETEKPKAAKSPNKVIKDVSFFDELSKPDLQQNSKTKIALMGQSLDLVNLDKEVKSMMIFSDNIAKSGSKVLGRARICRVCGKEGSMDAIMKHIEANHMNEVSIPCNICGKVSKTRNSLAVHKSTVHRKMKY